MTRTFRLVRLHDGHPVQAFTCGTRPGADYGYASGTILGSSGHLRVVVDPAAAEVAYVGSDGIVADRYSLPPCPPPDGRITKLQ